MKRLRGHVIANLCGTGADFRTSVPSAFLTLHQPLFPSLDTWLSSTVVFNCRLRFQTLKKPLNPLHFHCSIIFLHSQAFQAFLCNPRSSSTLSISNFLQRSSDHRKVTLLLLLWIFAAFQPIRIIHYLSEAYVVGCFFLFSFFRNLGLRLSPRSS